MPTMREYPLRGLARVYERLSSEPTLTYENIVTAFKRREHDSSKLRALGFEPRYTLSDTIRDSAAYLESEGLL